MKRILSLMCPALCLMANLAWSQIPLSSPQPAYGPDCAAALPVRFYTASNSIFAATYTVMLTDSAGTIRPAVSVTPVPPRELDTVLDLTGLATGAATITVQEPGFFGAIHTYPLAIDACGSGGGLVVAIYGPSALAPTWTRNYVLNVMNFGPPMPTSETLQLDGIPLSPDIGLNPNGATLISPTTTQGFQVSVPALLTGGSASFLFDLTTGTISIPNSFNMHAAFLGTYSAVGDWKVSVVASKDPNEKSGPPGFGPFRIIQGNSPLNYQVSFENDPSASAPAQRVLLTDQLDKNRVDPNTFVFGPITFGSVVVSPPAGVNPFSITVPYHVNGFPFTTDYDVNVQIDGGVDTDLFSPTFGLVRWTFQALDPVTGLPPSDPYVGFLPPDLLPPLGQGMVTFTVSPRLTLVTGNVITNGASIIFDANDPILTQVWTNRIDKTQPFISCPSDRSVPTDPNQCTAVVNAIAPASLIASPGIKSLTWELNGATTVSGTGNASGQTFNPGQTTVTYTLTDLLGRTTNCQFLVTVTHAALSFTGFLAPIGGEVNQGTGGSFADPVRAFKLGSTIPVKFQASCGGTPVATGVHTLQAKKYSSSVDGDPVIDATPTDGATTGNQFQLADAASGEWYFNLNTKPLSVGTWKLTATLSDGTIHEAWITIKK